MWSKLHISLNYKSLNTPRTKATEEESMSLWALAEAAIFYKRSWYRNTKASLPPSPHHVGNGPQQFWLLMSQCKSLTRRVYPSLSARLSLSFFLVPSPSRVGERGDWKAFCITPSCSRSGRHQPLSLVTEGRERGGEIKCETQRGGMRLRLMCRGV